MKKVPVKIFFLALLVFMPALVMAEVDVKVNVNIPLPPPIVFPAPPEVVVIPETYVYVVPDVNADIFFYGGWWWRPWQGRWYRSHYYDRGWVYYDRVPAFYRAVPPGWRNDYRDRRWHEYEWEHRRIPHRDAEKNWRSWEKDKHWEKEQYWGVKKSDRLPPGQAKKLRRYDDGPPKADGFGHQDGPGKGHGKGHDRGDR